MILRQRGEGRAVDHLQRRGAQHIQGALGGRGVRFNVGETFALQAVHQRPVGQGIRIKVEIDMEPEGGAPVRLAVEGDIPAHLFHQLLGDNQTQPGAAVAAGDTGIRLAERLEQAGLIALGDTDAGIADLHFDLHLGVAEGALLHQHIDITALGEFDGVAHQVGDHLLQTQRIADNVIRHVIFDIQRQLQPLIVGGVGQQSNHLIQRTAQREGDALEDQLARFQLREVQHVVDDGQQVIRRTLDGVQVVTLGRIEFGF